MLRDRADEVAYVGLGGVGLCGTHVADYLGAVEGDPVECLGADGLVIEVWSWGGSIGGRG